MISLLSRSWQAQLGDEFEKPYFQNLTEFVERERHETIVYPPEDQVYNALETTPFEGVKVVILGQDPYHGAGQAHGLSFSVLPGVKPPPSLRNIFRELKEDLGITPPNHGCLQAWAEQGVLLLNAVLTVRAGEANSHKNRGWETFTNTVIRVLSDRSEPMVFLLWGRPAHLKEALIDSAKHHVLKAAHPSPLSANQGFFGCKHFSRANEQLKAWNQAPVDWQIPDQPPVS